MRGTLATPRRRAPCPLQRRARRRAEDETNPATFHPPSRRTGPRAAVGRDRPRNRAHLALYVERWGTRTGCRRRVRASPRQRRRRRLEMFAGPRTHTNRAAPAPTVHRTTRRGARYLRAPEMRGTPPRPGALAPRPCPESDSRPAHGDAKDGGHRTSGGARGDARAPRPGRRAALLRC